MGRGILGRDSLRIHPFGDMGKANFKYLHLTMSIMGNGK
jgi:hypothetical protein